MVLNKKKINLVTVVALLIFGVAIFIYKESYTLINVMNLVIPIAGLIFILKNKNMFIFYAIVCFLITAFGGESNFAGIILCFMSVYDEKSKKSIWINIVLITVALAINVFKAGYLTLYPLAMTVAFFFVFAHMYVRFWDSPVINTHECDKKGFTPEQKDTIDILLKGLKHREAAEILSISRSAYTERVAVLRNKYGVKDDFQLALALVNDNIVSVDQLTNAKIEQKDLTT